MSLSIERELKNLMKTGRYTIGANSTIRAVASGRAKMVIVAENAPPELRERVLYYARLGNIPVYIFKGTSYDLGVACGKPFKISMLAVLDEGESKILELAQQQ
jgi:large subunit ribosomal protein L30e